MTRDMDTLLTVLLVWVILMGFLYATDAKITRTITEAVKEQCK